MDLSKKKKNKKKQHRTFPKDTGVKPKVNTDLYMENNLNVHVMKSKVT